MKQKNLIDTRLLQFIPVGFQRPNQLKLCAREKMNIKELRTMSK